MYPRSWVLLWSQDFSLVHQEFARALGVVVRAVAVLVGADVGVLKPQFAFLDLRETIAQVDAASTDRFDLCSREGDSRLKGFFYEVVMIGFSVGSNRLGVFHVGLSPRETLHNRKALRSSQGLSLGRCVSARIVA